MKILVDMNLPPRWVHFLRQHGHEATHWSAEGDIRASDAELLEWARGKGCVVLTHDLDFGLLLSMTRDTGPSVVQVRTQDVTPEALGSTVVAALWRRTRTQSVGGPS